MLKRSLALCAGLLILAGTALANPPEPQTEIGTWEAVEAARMVATQNALGDDPTAWEDVEGMALQNFPGNDGFGDRANDDNDTAHYARGSTLIIHVFISHNGGTWDGTERNAANAKAIVAKEHFLDIAPAAANLHFDNEGTTVYHYYSADLPYTIGDSGTNGTVVEDALEQIGFSDSDGDGTRVDEMTMHLQGWNGGYDNVIASFQADVTGRAWASYGTAQIRLYNDSSGNVWAHEMGHSFGACDEYTEGGQCNGGIDCGLCQSWYLDYDVDNGNCQLAGCPVDVSCIMINNTFSNVCDYTLQHWGWWDGNSNGQLDKVKRRVSGSTYTNIWEVWHNGSFYWSGEGDTAGVVAAQMWNSWAVYSLRSPDTADYDPYLYADNNHNRELANSYTGYTVDFIVGDYNHSRIGNEHIGIQKYNGDSANYTMDFESGTDVLYADGILRNISWVNYEVARAYELPLFEGENIGVSLTSPSAGMDLGIALFKSNGDTYFAGRTSSVALSDLNGVDGGESFTYSVPEDDVYGLIVFSNTAVSGDFDLRIGPAPYTLSEENPYYSAYDLRLFNYDPNAYYWSVIGTRPDATTNVTGTLYADENYVSELASSALYGNGETEFVAVDYLHAPFSRDHWRVVKTAGTDNHRSEWEHDGEIMTGWESLAWADYHVAKIWDFRGTGGQDYFFREYHSGGDLDTGIYLFSSNDGDNYKARHTYQDAANYQDPSNGGEWFHSTMPDTDWYGFVTITNDDNGGAYTILAGPDNSWSEDVAQTWADEVTYGHHTIPWGWWTVWGVRPGSGGSTGIWLYGDPAYTIDTLAVDDQSSGDGVNFVVGDYNHIGSGMTVYPRTIKYLDGGSNDMEFESGGEVLSFDPGTANSYDLSWPTGDVVEIWDVWLEAGEQLHLIVEDLSGNLDLGASFFASNGAAWYGSEENATASSDTEPAGGTEMLDFTATVSDWYGLVVHSNNDNGGDYRIVVQDLTTVAAGDLPVPLNGLRTSSANPFAGSISLMYSLAGDGPTELDIFDVRGRRVRTLVRGADTAGRHETVWDGKNDSGQDLPGGVYLARLRAGGELFSAKLIRMH